MVTLAILAALKRRGLRVISFKVGPDFIDPGHHTQITGTACRNLDGWMLSKSCNQRIFQTHIQSADVAVVEGVMGLFDGYDGQSESGSTAQMAKWLNLPVLLVVNAERMARSAAAVVSGFERFDPELQFAGVLFNQLGSMRHLNFLKESLSEHVKMPCIGGILKNPERAIPERHLGLVTLHDHPLSAEAVDHLADFIESAVDMETLLAGFADVPADSGLPPVAPFARLSPVRIGVAMDAAFCFYYPDNLDALTAQGAELVTFSPLSDVCLPKGLSGIYLGGGYPELHAEKLAANHTLCSEILSLSKKGMPIYAECGGFMYLCRELTDMNNQVHPLVGCFPFSTRMLKRLKTLGYREITLKQDSVLGCKGLKIRGHEFHYSEMIPPADIPRIYDVSPRSGDACVQEGFLIDNTLGSYIHLHFGSNPDAAATWVEACRRYASAMMQEGLNNSRPF